VGGSLGVGGARELPHDLQVGGWVYGFTGDASQVPPNLMDKLR